VRRGACGDGVRASGLAPGKRQRASAVQGYGSRNWGRACEENAELGLSAPWGLVGERRVRLRGHLGVWGLPGSGGGVFRLRL